MSPKPPPYAISSGTECFGWPSLTMVDGPIPVTTGWSLGGLTATDRGRLVDYVMRDRRRGETDGRLRGPFGARSDSGIPLTAVCPRCRRRHSSAPTVTCGCGLRLTRSVPAIAPPMGGPAWWGWRSPTGRTSWDLDA